MSVYLPYRVVHNHSGEASVRLEIHPDFQEKIKELLLKGSEGSGGLCSSCIPLNEPAKRQFNFYRDQLLFWAEGEEDFVSAVIRVLAEHGFDKPFVREKPD